MAVSGWTRQCNALRGLCIYMYIYILFVQCALETAILQITEPSTSRVIFFSLANKLPLV